MAGGGGKVTLDGEGVSEGFFILLLLKSWIWKFEQLKGLPLIRLLLDFTDCYGRNGVWLGRKLAKKLGRILRKKSLRILTVLAPDDQKWVEITRVLGGQKLNRLPWVLEAG